MTKTPTNAIIEKKRSIIASYRILTTAYVVANFADGSTSIKICQFLSGFDLV